MKRRQFIALYVFASLLVLAIGRPGYDAVGGIVVLLSGVLGSLKLAVFQIPSITSEDLNGVTHFSWQTSFVVVGSIIVWLMGGALISMMNDKRRRAAALTGLIVSWLVFGPLNLFLIAVASV
jgi:hypothetical protein